MGALAFYVFLFLVFLVGGNYLYNALCDENGEFLGDYARWIAKESETQFLPVTISQAKAQILGWMIGPGLLVGLLVSPALIPVGAALGWNVPRWLVNQQTKKRRVAFESQLVDALVLLSNALRSGLSLMQAFKIVVKEMPPPISQELELVLREQQISAQLDEALMNLSRRMQSKDMDIVITAILTLRETGGNLPETFDTVTYTIRERKKVEGKIDSLTTMGMTQGIVACILPWGFLLFMGVIQPNLVKPLFTTTIGMICLVLATILDILGYFVIKKVVAIKV